MSTPPVGSLFLYVAINIPASRDTNSFFIVIDLVSVPTRVPDRGGDRSNTLNLFLSSNPKIYTIPTVDLAYAYIRRYFAIPAHGHNCQ